MAVPATQEDLEKGLITAMGMATLHRPLVVCVDGIDRLQPRDPARRMLWVPKSLPFHCRLIVVATPDMTPRESLSMFRKENVVEIQPPPLVAVQSLAEDIVAAEDQGRRVMTSDETAEMAAIFAITNSLSLLKLSSIFVAHPGWVQLGKKKQVRNHAFHSEQRWNAALTARCVTGFGRVVSSPFSVVTRMIDCTCRVTSTRWPWHV